MSPRITIVLLCLGVLLGLASANPQYQQQRYPQRQYQQYPQYPQQRQFQGARARTMGGDLGGPFDAPGGDGGLGGPGGAGGPGDFPPPGGAGGVDPCAPNILASNRRDRVAH